jgi:hypothetical protein
MRFIAEKMIIRNRKTMEVAYILSLRCHIEKKDRTSCQSILQEVTFASKLRIIRVSISEALKNGFQSFLVLP